MLKCRRWKMVGQKRRRRKRRHRFWTMTPEEEEEENETREYHFCNLSVFCGLLNIITTTSLRCRWRNDASTKRIVELSGNSLPAFLLTFQGEGDTYQETHCLRMTRLLIFLAIILSTIFMTHAYIRVSCKFCFISPAHNSLQRPH